MAEYADRISGKHSDREEFQQMFRDASKRKFDLLLFWSLDRLSREEELEARLFCNQSVLAVAVRQRSQPDWNTIHQQLQQHRHLALQLVCEEYRQESRGVSLQFVLRALSTLAATSGCGAASGTQSRGKDVRGLGGAAIPNDWASLASIVVCSVLGASSYTYAEATRDQQLEA